MRGIVSPVDDYPPSNLPLFCGGGASFAMNPGIKRTISDDLVERLARTEDALRARELSFQLIVESIPVPVAVTTPTGEVEAVNQPTLEYFGKTFEELRGWKASDVVHPDDLERTIATQQKAHETGAAYNVESRHRRADGTYRWFNVRGFPLRDNEGRILRWFHLLIDIDDRKRAEAQLAGEKVLLEMVAAGGPLTDVLTALCRFVEDTAADCKCGVYLIDWSGPTFHTGAAPSMPATFNDALEGLTVETSAGPCAQAALTGSQVIAEDLESDLDWRQSLIRPLALSHGLRAQWSTPIRSRDGRVLGTFAIFQDHPSSPTQVQQDLIAQVTHIASIAIERALADEALRSSERNLSLTINTIPTFISVSRPDGTVLSVNQAALDYHGITLQDVQKEDFHTRFFHSDDAERVRDERKEALKRPLQFEYETRALGKDGKYRWFLVRCNPLLDDQGTIDRWYATAFDIEDRKRAEWLRAAETQTLQMITDGASLLDTLSHVCSSIDLQISPWFTTILLIDPDGNKLWPAAGPKVPQEWTRAMTPLPVAADTGLCGTAAFLKTRVIVPDVAAESIWREEYRGPALKNGIRAGWSQPILTKDNQVLGTFAVYSAEPRVPTDEDLALIQAAGRITLIAIERQQSQEALRNALAEIQKSESKLRQVIDAIPAMAWSAHSDGTGEFLNQQYLDYVGLSAEQVRDWGWTAAIHPDDREGLTRTWHHIMASEQSGEAEARLRRHDGEYRWFLFRASPVRDDSGRVVKWYGTNIDITERKLALESLQANQELLDLAQKSAGAMAFDWYVQKQTNRWSPEQEALYGLLPGTFDGTYQSWKKLIYPADWPALLSAIEHAHETGDVRAEFRVKWPDGSVHWLATNGQMFFDDQGKPFRMVGFTTDVTRRKLIEEELRRSAAFLEQAQQLSRTGSFSWRVATDEITWSDELYRIYEFNPGIKITLERIRTRVHPEDLTLYEKMVEQARNGADDFEWHYRLLMPDQSVKYMHAVAQATRDPNGQLEYIAAVRDVTARRLSDEALDKARSELAHVARVMSLGALTASIAHEVNQPLSGIITNASTCVRMLDGDPPNVDGARETAKRTIRDGRRAADVITRLRALFSKKDAAFDLVDLNEVTREVIALSRSELERNRVIAKTEFKDELPLVAGDRVQLQQVILNLLRNGSDAMSDVGDRPRELLFRTEVDEADRVRVTVQDAGVGFELQTLDQLFQTFYTTKEDGMGIGLSVSRSIIENHHGRLWATPNDGPGVTFSFSIPCAVER
jgi:PAS domain S-box-containing protein